MLISRIHYKKINLTLGLFMIVAVSSCAPMTVPGITPLTQEEIANADYGSPPPENYAELVKSSIRDRLIDPTSPIFEIGEPAKGYTNQSIEFGTQKKFGWQVCGTVNSKNRYGGYIGKVPFYTLFEGDEIISTIVGEGTIGRYRTNYSNVSIETACNRRVD